MPSLGLRLTGSSDETSDEDDGDDVDDEDDDDVDDEDDDDDDDADDRSSSWDGEIITDFVLFRDPCCLYWVRSKFVL